MGAIVSSLNQVTEAANQAAAAIERLNSAGRGGGGGGGGGGGLGRGFMTGGFTGNVSRRRVAGHVHGREFVVNAGATRGNRAALEQLNKTGSLPSTRSGGNVTINNNAGVAVSTSTNRDGDLMIEVDRRIERSNQNLDGRLAALTGNPNSRFSKSLRNNTKGGSRRRSG